LQFTYWVNELQSKGVKLELSPDAKETIQRTLNLKGNRVNGNWIKNLEEILHFKDEEE
jgi:hypothetical protein